MDGAQWAADYQRDYQERIRRQILYLQHQRQQPVNLLDLNLHELSMSHLAVLLWRFSGSRGIEFVKRRYYPYEELVVRRKHRCAACINNLATACRITHRWFYYNKREEIMVLTKPPFLEGMSERQIRTWCFYNPGIVRRMDSTMYGSNILRYVGRARRRQQAYVDPSEWPLGGEFYHTSRPYMVTLQIGWTHGVTSSHPELIEYQ